MTVGCPASSEDSGLDLQSRRDRGRKPVNGQVRGKANSVDDTFDEQMLAQIYP